MVIATEVGAGPGGQALIAALASAFFCAGLRASHPDYRTVLASRGPALISVPNWIGVHAHRSWPQP
jgi:hypothetical protein